jgi:Mn-dependent DtxR family transcriptional regulator
LGSARRAGPHLIVSRSDCAQTLEALTAAGLVREQRGHIVLTAKGRERRRLCDGRPIAA